MPGAAQGRFGSAGERPRHFRQYNVSADTGAFEMRSRWARPRCSASKYDGLAEAPARTGRTVRARALVSCAGLGVLVLVPVPCRLLGLCMHYDATCRLDHVRMTQHAKDYLLERKTNALPFSFTLTGVLCALELVADMPHACDDTCGLAHARMASQNYECARGRKRMRRAHSHVWVVRLYRGL